MSSAGGDGEEWMVMALMGCAESWRAVGRLMGGGVVVVVRAITLRATESLCRARERMVRGRGVEMLCGEAGVWW